MKKFLINIFNLIIIGLIVNAFYGYNTKDSFIISNNLNSNKLLKSKVLYYKDVADADKIKDDNTVINKIDDSNNSKVVTNSVDTTTNDFSSENKSNTDVQTNNQNNNNQDTNNIGKDNSIIDFYKGTLTSYGVNCYGCSFKTASGYDISSNIYYNDKTYGNIRILAGDSSYPFGSVVRIRLDKEDIMGIVLDRGSDIGFNKKFNFDLLFKTNKEAYNFGSKNSVTFEILRLGY